MKTREIENIILKDLCDRGFPVFLPRFEMAGFSEADVFGINKNKYIYEYEIKTSKADFKADFKKTHKHRLLKERKAGQEYYIFKRGTKTNEKEFHIRTPNRFFYACVPSLITPEQIPLYAGLIYIYTKTNYLK